jgi:hypothetical protein
MVIRFWVVSRTGSSLREALIDYIDKGQSKPSTGFPIWMGREKKPGRNPGWAKAYRREDNRGGVVNFEWNKRSRLLECQAVSKGKRAGRPYLLLGEFISVLMRLPGRPLKSIHIEVDRRDR